jgi:hypothetical protein
MIGRVGGFIVQTVAIGLMRLTDFAIFALILAVISIRKEQ